MISLRSVLLPPTHPVEVHTLIAFEGIHRHLYGLI